MRARPATDEGFTLMEVLAALLIFSVAILGLMASVRQSVRVATDVELVTYAGIVAENAIAEARSDIARDASSVTNLTLSVGEDATYLGREFRTTHDRRELEDGGLIEHRIEVLHEDRAVATRLFYTALEAGS